MDYHIYTRGHSPTVSDALRDAMTPETTWERVRSNASLTVWANTRVSDYFVYPLDVTLAKYQTGNSVHHALLLHYGRREVTADLDGWFHMYNSRQTVEAGIKEGKYLFLVLLYRPFYCLLGAEIGTRNSRG